MRDTCTNSIYYIEDCAVLGNKLNKCMKEDVLLKKEKQITWRQCKRENKHYAKNIKDKIKL